MLLITHLLGVLNKLPVRSHHINNAKKNISFLKTFYSEYKHNDWAITIGFYTALHIIEGAIYDTKKFTINKKQIEINGIEHARREFISKQIIKPNNNLPNHKIRMMLVQASFQEIEIQYKSLLDMAWSARYVQFSWSQSETFFAIECYLKDIIEWFNKNYRESLDSVFKKTKKTPQSIVASSQANSNSKI